METIINAPYELKTCPCCKKKPKLLKNEGQDFIGLACISYHVECVNPKCIIRPQTYDYTNINNYNNSSIAISKACYNWNSRGSAK